MHGNPKPNMLRLSAGLVPTRIRRRQRVPAADGGSFFVARATYPISDDRTKSLSWRALSRDPSFFCHAGGAVIAPRALAPFLRILVISPWTASAATLRPRAIL